jgi:hypothetical protein
MAVAWRRMAITALVALGGVAVAYFIAGGRWWWFVIFVAGLIAGRATRGGWLAGMAGVIGGHVVMHYVQGAAPRDIERAIDDAAEGALIGVALFTPGYLFAAAARLRKEPRLRRAATDEAGLAADDRPLELGPGAMVAIGCAILGVVGVVLLAADLLMGARGY